MSDKNFGVKQINIISGSGTPTITSPNDFNINAVTVGISTDISIGGEVVSDLIVGAGYSVGIGTTNPTETLTVKGNTSLETLSVSGITTFNNTTNFGSQCSISTTGNSLSINANTDVIISGYYGGTKIVSQPGANLVFVDAVGGDVSLYYQVSAGPSGSEKRLQTLGAGVTITGTTFTNQLNVSGVSTFSGNVRVGVDTSIGVILTSPNGTQFRLIVDDAGALSTVVV